MHDVVKVHGRVVVKKLCHLMEPVSRHSHREITTPFDGLYEAGGKALLESAGELL
jgi:hypothetical protein